MANLVNRNLIVKFLIICFFIIEVTNGKKLKSNKKSFVLSKKKHHSMINDSIKNLIPENSIENRKKFVQEEFESFKLKSEKISSKKENVFEKNDGNNKDKINDNEINNENKNTEKLSDDNIPPKEKENSKTEGNNYYLYGGGIVSVALVSVGFFNVYQRNRNSIFSLTKEELEALDKNKKLNNSYTSLSEEEKRFLHKINTRKHNNMKRYDELTEDEILEIRKKNGWADSDDGECQLKHRKINNRLSCNVKINNTNVIAPRRVSLNVKLDKNSDSPCNRSYDDIKKLKRKSMMPIKQSKSQESLNLFNKIEKNDKKPKTSLFINTKNIDMPQIKMVCTIIKNYKPLRPDEIELHLGDKVEIVNVFKDGWATGKVISDKNIDSKIGYFPLAHASEPEVFDDKINGFALFSPLTPPISRQLPNLSYQSSPLSASNSYPLPNINFVNSTTAAVKANKSKNRHVSMLAVSSSSSILTQEPLSINSSVSSIININNNINIINTNDKNEIPNNININININNNNEKSSLSNSISINNTNCNETASLFKTNEILTSNTVDNLKHRSTTPSILDPQSIKKLLNDVLEEENNTSNRIASSYSSNRDSLPCHSQEVFDFLRSNVYNSKISMEEREYYKKCLERLRISKIIDTELVQTNN